MKLYTFVDGDERRVAANVPGEEGVVVDLIAAGGEVALFTDMLAMIAGGDESLEAARAVVADAPKSAVRRLEDIALAAPIPRPSKLRGFSVFERHLRQSVAGAGRRIAAQAPDPEAAYQEYLKTYNPANVPGPGWYETPGYYLMDTGCVTGSGAKVAWPSYSHWIDYELEVVAVIGKSGRNITREQAGEHIFGYTIVNDLSARDAQLKAMSTGLGFGKGKDFDDSNVMGPCIVTADEIPDPYALRARVLVNGDEWSNTDGQEAQFRFDQCIQYASQDQVIHSGELFSTGTWPNCSSIELVKTVNRGDKIEFVVEGIGTLQVVIA